MNLNKYRYNKKEMDDLKIAENRYKKVVMMKNLVIFTMGASIGISLVKIAKGIGNHSLITLSVMLSAVCLTVGIIAERTARKSLEEMRMIDFLFNPRDDFFER